MKPNFVVVSAPGLRGQHGLNGIPAPLWAWPNNSIADVVSIVAEHLVDQRLIQVGDLDPDNIIEGTIMLFIPPEATHGQKFFRVCIGNDPTSSFIETFDAAQTGTVELRVRFMVRQAAPHVLNAMYFFNEAVWNQGRGEVAVNIFTSIVQLELRAWLENALDSIKIDSVAWRLVGSGRA